MKFWLPLTTVGGSYSIRRSRKERGLRFVFAPSFCHCPKPKIGRKQLGESKQAQRL